MVHVVFVWDEMPHGPVGSCSREESRHLLPISWASERSLPAGLCFTVASSRKWELRVVGKSTGIFQGCVCACLRFVMHTSCVSKAFIT